MKPYPVRRLLILFLVCGLTLPLMPGCARQAGAKLPEIDDWDVAMIKGQRIGHAHTTVRHVEEAGRATVKVRQLLQLVMQRFGDETRMEIDYSDTETPDGQLIDFEIVAKQGATPMRTTGKVAGKLLEVQIETQGQTQKQSVAWPAGAGGLLAPELSLCAAPLKPGERRTIEHLNFDNQVCTTELTARKEEQVELLGSTCRLLKIDAVDRIAADAQGRKTEIKGAYWANATGDVLKSWIEPMNMETYRVTEQVALAKIPPGKLDLGEAMLVKVDRPIPHAHDTKWVRYRIHIDGGDPVAAFPAGPSQEVKRIDDHTAEVTVRAIRPEMTVEKGGTTSADKPGDDDRKPNNFIQCDDPLIVAQAKEAVGGETDPWKQAVALEAYVHRAVTMKDFSQALDTASDVARSHEGDCTEHAVYLAALARARNIPARVAVGLVYMPQAQTFGYHMWTELYVADRWIAMDGTLAKGGIGGGHLQLAHSPMAGVAAYNVFYPVMQVIGRLKIEVLDWE